MTSTTQYATRYSESKKSDAYYTLITRVYDKVKQHNQNTTNLLMQYMSDMLIYTDGKKPTAGQFIEYNYTRIVKLRHSARKHIYIITTCLNKANELMGHLPQLCCVIARPMQMPGPEQFIDIVESVQDETLKPIIAVMLCGLRITRPRKLLKARKGFYNPQNNTFMEQKLPQWAGQYIQKRYAQVQRDKDSLFLEEPSKEHIHRMALKIQKKIKEIKETHNIDIETIFRYRSYWENARPGQLHYAGPQHQMAIRTLQKAIKNHETKKLMKL